MGGEEAGRGIEAGTAAGRYRLPEEPALAAGGHLGVDVEEGGRDQRPVLNHADAPGLLQHEDARGVAGGKREVSRVLEARDKKLGGQRGLCGGGRCVAVPACAAATSSLSAWSCPLIVAAGLPLSLSLSGRRA